VSETQDEQIYKYLYDIIIENQIVCINKEHINDLTKIICILPKIIYLMRNNITENTFI
jgi:hypothetical protein